MTRFPLATLTAIFFLTACSNADDHSGNGPSSLTIQTSIDVLEPACPYGGTLIRTGVDYNGDGQLGDNEVTANDPICNNGSSPNLDVALKQLLTDANVHMDATAGRVLPTIDDPLAQLGMQLFFSKSLGGDQDSACVTCHHPFLGGGDDLTLPVGVHAVMPNLLGPGREHAPGSVGYDGGPTVPRNAPTTFNIALWDKVLFHDGRIESLTGIPGTNGADGQIRTPEVPLNQVDPSGLPSLTVAQARFPVTSAEEMRAFTFEAGNVNTSVRAHLAARLQGNTPDLELATNNWLAAFRTGFGNPTGTPEELITYDNIALAIGTYEASQVFVDTPFKRYLDGDDAAISGEAKLGAMLFYGDGGCANCHSGPTLTDERFHVLAMPQVGRGKGNDNGVNANDDFGRYRETGVEDDRYAFRTPMLLNVAQTGPWGHAGAYGTLTAVVQHHLNPRQAIENFDYNQLDPGVQADDMVVNTGFALDKLDALRAEGKSALPDVSLSGADVHRLVAFLETLTDSCVQNMQCIGRWVPGITDADPDALRVDAIDRLGNRLEP